MMAQNWPGGRTAQVGLINIRGFRTPAAVVRCGFRTVRCHPSQNLGCIGQTKCCIAWIDTLWRKSETEIAANLKAS